MKCLTILLLLSVPLILPGQGKDLSGVDPTGATITYWFQHTGPNGDAMMKQADLIVGIATDIVETLTDEQTQSS